MKLTLIHNPESGDERLDREALLELFAGHGFELSYAATRDPDWTRALEAPADIVAVAGGDGTVAKVLAACGTGAAIAILPLGTANNVAKHLGIGGGLADIVEAWATAPRWPFDVGALTCAVGAVEFTEAVGAGFFASAVDALARGGNRRSFPSRAAHLRHDIEALLGVLAGQRPHPVGVWVDGRDLSGDYLAVEVMNTSTLGPHLSLAPDADVADGLLDVVLLSDRHRRSLEEHLLCQLGCERPEPLPALRGREVHLVPGAAGLHVDGNPWDHPGDHLVELRIARQVELVGSHAGAGARRPSAAQVHGQFG